MTQLGEAPAIPVHGLLVIDKPAGCTSHDVVARCRRVFGQKKVGHAGTLDPDATGVLLVGLGQATRLLQFFSGLPKRYGGEVVLGVATTTLDAAGEVTGTWDMTSVTLGQVSAAAADLTGDISQVPPMVSAIKVGGRRLHELARAGVEVERSARQVSVTRFDVQWAGTGDHGPVVGIDVECSSGTYVRSLAADLGAALGGGAHLRNLRRSAVGRFTLAGAVSLEVLEASARPADSVIGPVDALVNVGMASAVVGHAVADQVGHGRVLPMGLLPGAVGAGPWAVVSETGVLLAVYEAHRAGEAKPSVVLSLS